MDFYLLQRQESRHRRRDVGPIVKVVVRDRVLYQRRSSSENERLPEVGAWLFRQSEAGGRQRVFNSRVVFSTLYTHTAGRKVKFGEKFDGQKYDNSLAREAGVSRNCNCTVNRAVKPVIITLGLHFSDITDPFHKTRTQNARHQWPTRITSPFLCLFVANEIGYYHVPIVIIVLYIIIALSIDIL